MTLAIGTHVKVTEEGMWCSGLVGTVIAGEEDSDDIYGVEFEEQANLEGMQGHDCGGEAVNGWWLCSSEFEVVEA